MPQTDPFTGMLPDRKMTNEELARALRLDLAAELDATNLYTAHAEATDNPLAKKILNDITNEELVHAGEFLRLLKEVNHDEWGHLEKGVEEVRQKGGLMEEEEYHHSPISAHCVDVLANPPKCYDFRGVRSYVLCRAWDLLEKEKLPTLPVSRAWQEARKVCVGG